MTNRVNEKLAAKLRQFPADDDTIVPVVCPYEKEFINDFMAITKYGPMAATELELKQKRKPIRSYSCLPSGFAYLVQDSLRMTSQVRQFGLRVEVYH